MTVKHRYKIYAIVLFSILLLIVGVRPGEGVWAGPMHQTVPKATATLTATSTETPTEVPTETTTPMPSSTPTELPSATPTEVAIVFSTTTPKILTDSDVSETSNQNPRERYGLLIGIGLTALLGVGLVVGIAIWWVTRSTGQGSTDE
ncbi:MAG: hypothetical protein ISR58_18630 [Anaerolineales bacterium]|nr:hypothetical protein [Chloroflexota bacterium]MBL6983197.1 hypothetical protein [Anaerolineales bacterium]